MSTELVPIKRDDAFEFRITTEESGRYQMEVNFPNEEELPSSAQLGSSDERPKEEIAGHRFDRLLDRWTSTCISFFETIPKLTDEVLSLANAQSRAEIIAFAEEVALERSEIVIDGKQEMRFTIHENWLHVMAEKLGSTTNILKSAHLMRRATLSSLVSEYEIFISDLMMLAFTLQPTVFVGDKETIAMSEVAKFENFNDLKRAIAHKKIEELLHDSHVKQLEWIGGKFGVNLLSNEDIIADFVEVCQRRHLVIHAGAVVNQRYLDNCSARGGKKENLAPLGTELLVSREYLRTATARLYLVGYFSAQILMQKLQPSIVGRSYGNMIEHSHNFLCAGLTKMARHICLFGLSSKKPRERVLNASLTINLALSFYMELDDKKDRDDAVRKALDNYDWSDTSALYELAISCLFDDFEHLERLTKSAIAGGLSRVDAHTWTIFSKARETTDFLSYFEQER